MKCTDLWNIFKKADLTFFTGIPDSTFKDWMNFLSDTHDNGLTNIIACNECEAVALAAGYHLATGKIGIVYMQNSGEGKTVNPLTSLCDPKVYSIPVLMMIGWRGEPGQKDEPQHKKMGEITLSLLEVLGIPYEIMTEKDSALIISKAVSYMKDKKSPYALIIKNDLFEKYDSIKEVKAEFEMTREDAIKIIVDSLDCSEVVVSTTGKTSRELFENRVAKGQKPIDFYTVGSMGCSASIAHGIALKKPTKKVFVFDGDGAAIMQMGALATIGHYKPKNLYHVIFDNESHDSTGGQPTVSKTVDFEHVALACGYESAKTLRTKKELNKALKEIKLLKGPVMLVIKVKKGARKDLGRPTTTPIENKQCFMEFLSK